MAKYILLFFIFIVNLRAEDILVKNKIQNYEFGISNSISFQYQNNYGVGIYFRYKEFGITAIINDFSQNNAKDNFTFLNEDDVNLGSNTLKFRGSSYNILLDYYIPIDRDLSLFTSVGFRTHVVKEHPIYFLLDKAFAYNSINSELVTNLNLGGGINFYFSDDIAFKSFWNSQTGIGFGLAYQFNK